MPTKKRRSNCRIRVLLPLFLLLLPALPGQASQFVLLYSNDNLGEIEPCG
jgi:hypothetical protein